MDNRIQLEMIVSELQRLRHIIGKRLLHSGNKENDHRLLISKERNITRFYEVRYENGKRIRTDITNDPDRIYELASLDFYKEKLSRISNQLERIKDLQTDELSLDYDQIIQALPKNYQILEKEKVLDPKNKARGKELTLHPVFEDDLRPMILKPNLEDMMTATFRNHPAEIKERLAIAGVKDFKGYTTRGGIYIPTPEEWTAMPYRANTKHMENLIQKTSFGIKTRSKSEIVIAQLHASKVFYFHYDEVFVIENELASPDFNGLKDRTEVRLLEHKGLNTYAYNKRDHHKRYLYSRAGFTEGTNLFYTFDDESGSINIQLLNAQIDALYGII